MATSSNKSSGSYGTSAGSSASSAGYGGTSSNKSSGSYGTSAGSSASSAGYGGTSSNKSSGSYGTSAGSSASSAGYGGSSKSSGSSGSYGTSAGSSASSPGASPSKSGTSSGSRAGGNSGSGSYGTAAGSSASSKGFGSPTSAGPGRGPSTGGPSISTPTGTSPGFGWGNAKAADRASVPGYAGRGSVTDTAMAAARAADRLSTPTYNRSYPNLPATGMDTGRYAGGTWGTTGAGFNRAVAERYQGLPTYGGPGEHASVPGGTLAAAADAPTGYTPDLSTRTRMSKVSTPLREDRATRERLAPTPDLSTRTRMGSVTVGGQPVGALAEDRATRFRGLGAPTSEEMGRVQQARIAENATMKPGDLAADYATDIAAPRAALAQQARESEIASGAKLGEWGKQVKSVVAAGPGWTTVELNDGSIEKRSGLRSVRNNNPGNIEFGNFAKKHGAIGTDGRFAVFSSIDDGFAAQTDLLGNYAKKGATISSMVSKYAPAFENNPTAYAAAIAGDIGVPVGTKMSDLTPKQMNDLARAMHKVEGVGEIQTAQVKGPKQGYTEVAGYYGQTTPAASQIAAGAATPTAGPAAGGVESRAQNAAASARQAALDSIAAQGQDPKGPVAQAAADLAAKEAYNAVMTGTSPAATEPVGVPTPVPAAGRVTQTVAPAAAPAPASTIPKGLRVQHPTAAQPYERSLFGQVFTALGDVAIPLPFQAVSLLTTGNTVMGNVWDASHGRYGENQYSPGDTPERQGGGSNTDYGTANRNLSQSQTPTKTTPEKVAEEVAAVSTPPAEVFIQKYIDPPSEPATPIPEPDYNWVPGQHQNIQPYSWEV